MSNKKNIRKAVNWNSPEYKFYDDLWNKQAEQYWLPTEIPVPDDLPVWINLDEI